MNIGYRLAPKNPYPIHLIDIKRSLRWIKRTIRMFGGDPDFIVLSGSASGLSVEKFGVDVLTHDSI